MRPLHCDDDVQSPLLPTTYGVSSIHDDHHRCSIDSDHSLSGLHAVSDMRHHSSPDERHCEQSILKPLEVMDWPDVATAIISAAFMASAPSDCGRWSSETEAIHPSNAPRKRSRETHPCPIPRTR